MSVMTDRSADAQRKEFDGHWESDWLPLQSIGPLTDTRYRLVLARLPRGLSAGCRVLDAGCGPGALLERIGPRAAAHAADSRIDRVAARETPQ